MLGGLSYTVGGRYKLRRGTPPTLRDNEMKVLRNAAVAAIVASGLGWANGASATVGTVNLNIDHCTGGCLATRYASSVTVNDACGILAFDVLLTGNLFFQDSTGLDAFLFSLGTSPISITNLTSGFSLVSTVSGAIQEDGFGKFDYAIDYSGPRNVQELKFDVSAAGPLTLGDFTESLLPPGSASVVFAADVFSSNLSALTGNGNTGPIGGGVGPTPITLSAVPEPSTWAMGLIGFGFVGLMGYRRSRKAVAAAIV
jgi:hypothetical protein